MWSVHLVCAWLMGTATARFFTCFSYIQAQVKIDPADTWCRCAVSVGISHTQMCRLCAVALIYMCRLCVALYSLCAAYVFYIAVFACRLYQSVWTTYLPYFCWKPLLAEQICCSTLVRVSLILMCRWAADVLMLCRLCATDVLMLCRLCVACVSLMCGTLWSLIAIEISTDARPMRCRWLPMWWWCVVYVLRAVYVYVWYILVTDCNRDVSFMCGQCA